MDAANTRRCVYILPNDLHERVRQYQTHHNIKSEVEAARRLIEAGLQYRETFADIMMRVVDRLPSYTDLRALAGDLLITHKLVTSVEFGEGLVFYVGEVRGKIQPDGKTFIGEGKGGAWRSYARVVGES